MVKNGSMPIIRKITMVACTGTRTDALGQSEEFTEVLFRPVSDEVQASIILRRRLGDQSIIVSHIEQKTATYRMEIADFVAHATELED